MCVHVCVCMCVCACVCACVCVCVCVCVCACVYALCVCVCVCVCMYVYALCMCVWYVLGLQVQLSYPYHMILEWAISLCIAIYSLSSYGYARESVEEIVVLLYGLYVYVCMCI